MGGEPSERRNSLAWGAGGLAALLVLSAATFGALWLSKAAPFTPTVRVPPVINTTEGFAVPQLLRAGFSVRVVYRRRNIGLPRFHYIYAQRPASGDRVTKGSMVTVYSAIPAKHFHCAGPNGTPCPRSYVVHP